MLPGCFAFLFALLSVSNALIPPSQDRLIRKDDSSGSISAKLFMELEELARIVDISYCVGLTGLGIYKPFRCASRCSEFEDFELVKAWNTGPLLSDSCGYIALSHAPSPKRVIVAFRGTYSISNTIADLSTVPQQYVPYPGDDDDSSPGARNAWWKRDDIPPANPDKCDNCTVHMGFYRSWLNTRSAILSDLSEALQTHPNYTLTMVGHSLGGAVAMLGALDLKARGWDPTLTTFGEPRVGNQHLNAYIDKQFNLNGANDSAYAPESKLRRVTHANDPVPLLPLEEWGFSMHSGEIFISKPDLPPELTYIQHCHGDEDRDCIAGSDDISPDAIDNHADHDFDSEDFAHANQQPKELTNQVGTNGWTIPTRYKLWQLFFAHRDYFWRLGLCIPGGDPKDWYRKYPHYEDGDEF